MDRVGVVRMIVLLFVSTVSGTADPCQNHGIINQARRSSAAATDDPDLDICDIYLDRGWYRFTSYTGGEIPTSCVQPYRCSTQVPVWMNGTLPEGDDIVNRTACGNLGVPSDCCSIPMDIRVKRCAESAGVFYVYELEPTYFCPMAYCAGSLPLCPDGEVYDDYHKHCIETRPIVPCDFEGHGFCEWLQERDDELNWTKTSGQHSSGSVLPGVDHTIGTATGSYAFIRSSASNQPGDMARLISPIIVPSKTDTCNINFYYQVEGPETGTLRIYKKGYHSSRKSLVWTSPHNRISVWTAAVVSLVHANPFQVIIEGTLGSDGQSAIALDDVSFSSGCYIEVDGAVRLVDGTRFGEGRVEIYYNHEWGTICNRSSWTQTNGDVICSQLGYTSAVPSSRHYPAPSSTPIHLDEVWCSSANVTKISSCSHSRWGHYHPDCDHQKDISVACTGQWYRCRDTEFTCSNTICVPPEVQCDFTNDCGDNSDEQDCGQFPGRCDFQDGLCSWVQAISDSADWVRTDGGSETTTGAPPTDHRTRTEGRYLLLEAASAGTRNAVSTLSEYYLSIADDCKIFFHYFKTTSSGQLSLRLSTRRSRSAGWTVTSSSGGHWVREELVVPVNTTFQVSFEGIVEPSSGVIAIDDISLTPGCVRVQVDDPKTKDNPQTVSQKSGLPVSATVAITVVCSVFLLGLAVAAAALCYLRRKNSSDELRAAVHELEQRSGHDNPCVDHQYDYLNMHQTGPRAQTGLNNGTAVTFQNLQRCQGANGMQKSKQMPTVDASSDEKSVPEGLTVNMDSSGYAFLTKDTMCPAYTTDTAYTDPALCRFLKCNGFSEFVDMFTDKGLTLSFLRTASEKDLINFGIPIAIAVSVLKKLHDQPRNENEYTSLNYVGTASVGQPATKPIANVDM